MHAHNYASSVSTVKLVMHGFGSKSFNGENHFGIVGLIEDNIEVELKYTGGIQKKTELFK